MKVKHLHLQNYGRFEDLKIDFAPTSEKAGNVTVIVGNNGAGKSQILQSLATSLSWFVGSLKTGETIGSKIDLHSIKNEKNEASIKVIMDCAKDNEHDNSKSQLSCVQWQLSEVRDGRVRQLGNNFSQLNALAKRYRNKLTHVEKLSLPLVVFYPVERTILQHVEADIVSHGYDQLKGYYESLDGASIDFSNFISWFRNAEDIENEVNVSRNLNTIQHLNASSEERRSQLESEISQIKKSIELEIDINERVKLSESVVHKYEEIINTINLESQNITLALNLHTQNLSFISAKDAIKYFTDFKNIRIRRQGTPTMIVEKDGEELDVNQLSQGEKSLFALVGDIARRLAFLNPGLDNPLEGEGVVMIDEVDLHLHPKWQHDLIDKFVKTFPNVQFILTTHSPHVISDRPDILVYSLDDGELTQVPNIYGEDVNTVLTKVFDVPIRDPEAQADFDNVAELIYQKNFESAENYIIKLEKQMPENLELLRCRLHLTQAQLAAKKEG
ncbi:AAA family ATPase [Psychrobacter sp. ASPA161_6]|uniref:AAA family ATPase n=1 Tax=Psychrobacter sp. ASPA161_6 TaxID=3160962 RepID=UPI003F81C74A